MKNRVLRMFFLLAALAGTVCVVVFGIQEDSFISYFMSAISIWVTFILGYATYKQMEIQIKLDSMDKTPFYEMRFVETEEDIVNQTYLQNCLQILSLDGRQYLDVCLNNATTCKVTNVNFTINGKTYISSVKEAIMLKQEEVRKQEEDITKFKLDISRMTKDEIGDGLVIFDKWCEIDDEHSNYASRVRELLLHLYYYYEIDWTDIKKYRDISVSNKYRREMLEEYVSASKKTGFYDDFVNNWESIKYQLNLGILEWVENKDEMSSDISRVLLTETSSFYTNTDKFHLYLDMKDYRPDSIINLDFKFQTVYGYKYNQTIKFSYEDVIGGQNFPDERNILSLRKKLREHRVYVSRTNKEDSGDYYEYDLFELEKLENQRGKVKVKTFTSQICVINK